MNPKGCLRWLVRGIVLVVVLVIVAGVAGYFWEQRAETIDNEQYPPQGTLYDIDNRTIHLHCQGTGEPTIILDAGLGGWSIDYTDLQPILAQQWRTCSYDRAGYGWSDPAEGERNIQLIADDLLALMDDADVTDPVILVGFSFSGLHTRLLAMQHPERVQGLILLDPALENDNDLYSDQLLQQQQSLIGTYGFFGMLSEIGLVRLLNPEEMAPFAPFIPEGESERYYARVSTPEWWYVSQQEFNILLNGDNATVLNDAGTLPATIPVVVIGIDTYPEQIPEDIPAQREQNLRALADASGTGTYWIVEDVLHEDLKDESALILDAISWIIDPERATNPES